MPVYNIIFFSVFFFLFCWVFFYLFIFKVSLLYRTHFQQKATDLVIGLPVCVSVTSVIKK